MCEYNAAGSASIHEVHDLLDGLRHWRHARTGAAALYTLIVLPCTAAVRLLRKRSASSVSAALCRSTMWLHGSLGACMSSQMLSARANLHLHPAACQVADRGVVICASSSPSTALAYMFTVPGLLTPPLI